MAEATTVKNSQRGLTARLANADWRILLGISLTAIWISLGFSYIATGIGFTAFVLLPMADMGSFLEGAFAPLAFLWLVIGLFLQQKELANNNAELRKTNVQSERQTQAIAATEMNARQESFFKIAENTKRHLGSISGMLLLSSKGNVGDNSIPSDEMSELWNQFSIGDFEVFTRKFLMLDLLEDETLADLFYATDIRRQHSENFIQNFERMLKLASECDTDDIITDATRETAHGMLYKRMLAARTASSG